MEHPIKRLLLLKILTMVKESDLFLSFFFFFNILTWTAPNSKFTLYNALSISNLMVITLYDFFIAACF